MADRERDEGGGGGLSIALYVVMLGVLISGAFLGVVLVSHYTHTTVPAKCSPLKDPMLEHLPCQPCDPKEDNGDHPCHDGGNAAIGEGESVRCAYGSVDTWRAKILVEAAAYRSGWGKAVIVPRAWVYNTGDRDWLEQYLPECKWAAEHCICPGCNGTNPGVCVPDTDDCMPGTEGCERDAPEFKCFVDTTKLQSHWPNYGIVAHKVRFHEKQVDTTTTSWLIWVFVTGVEQA
ncbi:hypothetical protein T484DRAFT_1933242 [Baffinella frigidus]|nr:hypothetical protein T484DRAFT_1933242 [Cryptophyta sp. CCMP2293]